MSLKFFHIFFISACLGLGGFLVYISQSEPQSLVFLTGIFLILLLIPYSAWFLKKWKALSLFATLVISKAVEACPMCYSDTSVNSLKTVQATKTGIIFLGLLIVFVLSMIAFTGLTWAKRAQQLEKI